jgi:hypothetical protein
MQEAKNLFAYVSKFFPATAGPDTVPLHQREEYMKRLKAVVANIRVASEKAAGLTKVFG